jgi:hypothetical protein
LSNGKTKAVKVQESEKYKNWHIDDRGWNIPEQIIIKRQTIVDSFEMVNGFPKKFWEYGTFTFEQYIGKRKEKIKYRAKMNYMEVPLIPREIIVPKIQLIKEGDTFE